MSATALSVQPNRDTRTRVVELDALRAFAALAVMGSHFLPSEGPFGRLPEIGWIGVDLFFVLSGYFITTILLPERGTPFYYRRFYLRRAIRILPLYFAVLGSVLLFAKLSASGAAYAELKSEWGSPAWMWLFVGNIRSAILNTWPTIFSLTPMWSVHVEEQFYLLYPIAIALVPPRWLRGALCCAIVGALALRILFAFIAPPTYWKPQFALMPCRMDNLAMGALIALSRRDGNWPLSWKTTLRLGLLGIVLVGLMLYVVGPTPMPLITKTVGYSAIGLTCMMLVAWIRENAGRRSIAWLRWKPLCTVGKISYGLYLLHAPTAYMAKSFIARLGVAGFDKTYPSAAVFAVIAVLVAAASYYWFEEPLLKYRDRIEKWLLPSSRGPRLYPAASPAQPQ
jgi:peptidoglycan/LPS O-acetylase OafA/YrhL